MSAFDRPYVSAIGVSTPMASTGNAMTETAKVPLLRVFPLVAQSPSFEAWLSKKPTIRSPIMSLFPTRAIVIIRDNTKKSV